MGLLSFLSNSRCAPRSERRKKKNRCTELSSSELASSLETIHAGHGKFQNDQIGTQIARFLEGNLIKAERAPSAGVNAVVANEDLDGLRIHIETLLYCGDDSRGVFGQNL